MRPRTSMLILLPVLLLLWPLPGDAQPAPLSDLPGYIESSMREWQVPGFAIAVVRGDSVIFTRGFGVREHGRPGTVDEHTLFAIASTSKAFTAAALGMLVDERRLSWDDPVAQHLPTFQLQDPFISLELTVRDLLTHRAGLSRSDNLWIAAPFDRGEVLRRARELPVSRFRAEYGYNNIMYIAAGEVVGAVSGMSWDDFLEQRVFTPLQMTRSTTRDAVVAGRDNVASSHVRIDGRITPMARRNYDNIGGAGAVFSSAHDMAQWLRFHLNAGSYAGSTLLQPATQREMFTPQTVMRGDSVAQRMFPGTHFRAYGLGWNLQDYHGRKLVHHSGSINFTRTHIAMVPAEGIGVVAIANLSSSNLQQAMMYYVLDALLDLPPRDWSAEYMELARRSEESSERQSREVEASRILNTRASLPVDAYAGTYSSSVYGDVQLTLEDGRLVLSYSPDYVADVEHWHHDTFRAVWRRAGYGRPFVTFSLDSRARVAAMQMEGFGEFMRRR
jgi:CubicO group peptidase (beta-lactamase class C family)